MRNLMIFGILIFVGNSVLNAQVKDKFRDRSNNSTIVVVKEDGALDQKLLDEHFDLSNMSMSDQIMITTAPTNSTSVPAPDMESATSSTDDNIAVFFENFEEEEDETEVETSTETVSSNNKEVVEATIKPTVNAPKKATVNNSARKASSRARGNYSVKNSADVKKAAQKKYFGKKKRKKRKSRKLFGKKKSKSCYSF